MEKIWFGYLSIFIGVIGFAPYFYLTWTKQIRPHALSFLIWALSTGFLGFAQLIGGGESGAWLVLMYSVFCSLIFLLAVFYHGEKQIYVSDWVCLAFAVLGLMLWLLTDNPLWAVFILTAVDGAGYIPTYRKTYANPNEETLTLWLIGAVAFFVSILALEQFSLITAFYPVVMIGLNLGVSVLILRRYGFFDR